MNKFFTKQESQTICSLLSSRDEENIKLGMNLIITHSGFKKMKKCIIVRNKMEYIRWYSGITIKQSFGLFCQLHQEFVKKGKYIPVNTMFYRTIVKFVKKHTFNSK